MTDGSWMRSSALLPSAADLGPLTRPFCATSSHELGSPSCRLAIALETVCGETKLGQTPPARALRSLAPKIKSLLLAGADPNTTCRATMAGRSHTIHSAVYSACAAGYLEGFRLLVAHSTVAIRIDALTDDSQNKRGLQMPLVAALCSSSVGLVAELVAAGADPHAVCRSHSGLVHRAYTAAAGPLAAPFIAALGPLQLSLPCDERGETLLHWGIVQACVGNAEDAEEWVALVVAALAAGADPNARSCAPSPPLRLIEVIANVYGVLVHPVYAKGGAAGTRRSTAALLAMAEALAAAGGDMAPRPMEAMMQAPLSELSCAPEFIGTMCIDWATMACNTGWAELIELGLRRGWVRAGHVSASFDKKPLLVSAGARMMQHEGAPVLRGTEAADAFVSRRLAVVRALLTAGADPLALSALGESASVACARASLPLPSSPKSQLQAELDGCLADTERAWFEAHWAREGGASPAAVGGGGRLSAAERELYYRSVTETMAAAAAQLASTPGSSAAPFGSGCQ